MSDCEPGQGSGVVNGGLPDLELPCLGGGTSVNLSSLRGPMVINLWASWCEPCRTEMPILQAFHIEHDRIVKIVGLNVNDVHPDAALELAGDAGVTYPSLADPGAISLANEAFAFARRGLPAFVFIDSDGKVIGTALQGVQSQDDFERMVTDKLSIEF